MTDDQNKKSNSHAEALKKLEEQLTCAICLKDYFQPKVLQCFHTFCEDCLSKLADRIQSVQGVNPGKKQKISLACPSCRHPTALPPKGVSQLQSAFHIHHLFEIRDDLMKAAASSVEIESKFSRGSTLFCPDHDGEEVKVFCATCQCVGCIQCLFKHHKEHTHHLISDVIDSHKAEMRTSLQPILDYRKILEKTLDPLDARIKEMTSCSVAVENEINSTFAEVTSKIEARRVALLEELNLVTDKKLESLTTQREKTKGVLDKVNSCVDYVECNLEVVSAAKLMQMKGDMTQQVRDLAGHFKAPTLLEPKEEATIKFSRSADMDAMLQNFGKVYTYDVCAAKCNASGDGLKSARVGEKASAVLQAINFRDCLCEEPVESLECKLVSEITGSVVMGCVDRRDKSFHSLYDMSYVPTHKGRHRLHIKVEGDDIRGSPFAVSVSATEGGSAEQPISTLLGLKWPADVAITAGGKIVVTESERHCVSMFALNGVKEMTIGKGRFEHPCGITMDDVGNMLVLDGKKRQLLKFSPEGMFLQKLGDETVSFYSPMGVAFNYNNNSYYIADLRDHSVHVISQDFSTFSKFGERGRGQGKLWYPSSVACDDTGKVYVADSGNHRIQVFTAEGQYLRKFGKEGVGEGCLKCPSGLALMDGLVYVSEQDNHRVSVFTIEGDFVHCVGGRGSLKRPGGVAIDSGVLFVCNSENNCVQMF